jgi:hypothetical protein
MTVVPTVRAHTRGSFDWAAGASCDGDTPPSCNGMPRCVAPAGREVRFFTPTPSRPSVKVKCSGVPIFLHRCPQFGLDASRAESTGAGVGCSPLEQPPPKLKPRGTPRGFFLPARSQSGQDGSASVSITSCRILHAAAARVIVLGCRSPSFSAIQANGSRCGQRRDPFFRDLQAVLHVHDGVALTGQHQAGIAAPTPDCCARAQALRPGQDGFQLLQVACGDDGSPSSRRIASCMPRRHSNGHDNTSRNFSTFASGRRLRSVISPS